MKDDFGEAAKLVVTLGSRVFTEGLSSRVSLILAL
jgi:hypothetical protein